MSEELIERIAKLEAELAALKAQMPKAAEEPKERKPWPKYDPTEGFRLPASAAQAMAAVVPDIKRPQSADEVRDGAARARISQPSGFGPPDWRKPQTEPKPQSWQKPQELRSPPGIKYIDEMCDAQDAIDKGDLVRRIAGAVARKVGGK